MYNLLFSYLLVSHITVAAFKSPSTFATKRASTSLQNTWSNGQAIKEYHDYLESGKGMELMEDGASVILTDGTNPVLVNALTNIAMNSKDDVIVTISNVDTMDSKGTMAMEAPPESMLIMNEDTKSESMRDSYPIYMAVAPHNLKHVLRTLPQEWIDRSSDFVFISGPKEIGCIEPILRECSYNRDSTSQILLSGIRLDPPGEMPVEDLSLRFGYDQRGGEKWTGECAACGKWMGAIYARLYRNNVRCRTMFYREWRRNMWEWTAFVAVFNLVGGVREMDTTISDVSRYYEQEASDLLWSISKFLRGYLAVTMTYGFEERIFEFADMRGNGEDFFYPNCEISDDMYRLYFDKFTDSQQFCEYLSLATERKMFGTDVVPDHVLKYGNGELGTRTSAMIDGNLRSDGKV
eukprot:CAMPEP_0194365714 /NCGR_PEP_ID=MMETSP0174-20130528/13758_1 /TAXON_ID=216777 /ORGANISM="Proboscia alata, Strain PI-D3" /LENGTH=406 /DNA_ID=CAMNT_0039140541 /DNA_START=90 /DNA_END=1310 /DNA_ORIENTATION=-